MATNTQILEALKQLTAKVDRIGQDFDVLRNDVTSLRNNVTTLRNDVTTIHTNLDVLRTDVTTMHTDMKKHKAVTKSLRSKLVTDVSRLKQEIV
jgi:predicted  nucleic acid-binding Zn-ribbon protein